MTHAHYFKALQNKQKFRNPKNITSWTDELMLGVSSYDLLEAKNYINRLAEMGVRYTYPGEKLYPQIFNKMHEPPLFIEYIGEPVWARFDLLSVVGSRKIHPLTQEWMDQELYRFLISAKNVALVSGGALGVDQAAHLTCVKAQRPTVVVLPCGLGRLSPQNLQRLKDAILFTGGCFVSEFSYEQEVRKSFFYFRNRIIAAFSPLCFVAQAQRKSGTFLTVHHALQNGRVVFTLPAHPMMNEFSGNTYLVQDGAVAIQNGDELLDFWEVEARLGRGGVVHDGCI